jgi:hypothetical protein
MLPIRAILVALALVIAQPALAHDGKGPNGGRVADAGKHHVELVVGTDAISVFLSDANGKPLAPTGFKALAIVNHGGKAQRIALTAAEGKFSGRAEAPLPNNVKAVVQLTGPDGKTSSGQFK